MSTETDAWRTNLIWWLAISLAIGAAFWLGVGPRVGLVFGGSMLLLTVVIHVGRRRSDLIRVIGGAGDERDRELYTKATAAAGATLAIVILGWWLVSVARGEPNTTLSILWLVFGVSSIAASFYYSRRS